MPTVKKSSGKKSSGKKRVKNSSSSKSSASASASASASSSAPTETVVAPTETVVAPTETVVAPTETVVAPTETVVAPTETVETSSPLENIEAEFASITSRLQELKTLQMSITSDLKKLHKNVHRHIKESGKKNKRKKNEDPNRPKRAPSGFAKPSLISNELCKFLKKPSGTEMARTEVTKYLTQYIRDNKLQDQSNRRKIVPDKHLQKLLNVGSKDEVTYFNLQKYMKVHFPKSPEVSA